MGSEMATWVVWSVLILAIYSEANVSSNDIHKGIEEGQEAIRQSANISQKQAEEIRSILNVNVLDLTLGLKQVVIEAIKLGQTYGGKMNKIVNECFEKGIDQDADTTILLKILETKESTEGEFQRILANFEPEVTAIHEQKKIKLQIIEKVLDFTNEISKGFYEGLIEKMADCKDSSCIKQMVNSAEGKQKSLTKIFKKYEKEISDVSGSLEHERRNCLHGTGKKFSRALKNLEHDLEDLCLQIRGDQE